MEEETESIQTLLEEQSVTIDEIMAMMASKEEEVLVLMSSIEEKQEKVNQLSDDIDAKHDELDTLNADIEASQLELDETVKRYEKNMELAKRRFQSLQIEEQNTVRIYIEAVMQSESIADVFGRISAVSKLLGAHNDLITNVQKQATNISNMQDDLELQKRQVTQQTKELEAMEIKVRSEQDVLKTERSEAETLIAILDEEREMIELEYADNMDALNQTMETLDGQRLFQEMIEAEEERLAMIPDDIMMTPSSSRNSVLTALSRVREGQRDADVVSQVIRGAEKYIGVPYVWGGTTPSGFDCSGLVQLVYGQAGISLPRTSAQQARVGKAVAVSDAQPGDLLFWDKGGQVYHVAIYIGGGEYIHAPRPGKTVNITSVIHFTPNSARRVISNSTVAPTPAPEPAPVETPTESPAETNTEVSVQDDAQATNTADLIGHFEATAYAIGDGLTPSTMTANGTDVANTIQSPEGHRIIAVDTSVIPMDTIVRVELPNGDSFTAKASDTGSAINGHKIDILMSSPRQALHFGRQRGIKVYNVE